MSSEVNATLNIEKCIIAALMRDNALLDTAAAFRIEPEWFTLPAARDAYVAICTLTAQNAAADLPNVAALVPEYDSEIAEFDLEISTTVNFGDWCRTLRNATLKQNFSAELEKFKAKAADPAADAQRIAADLIASLDTMASDSGGKSAPNLRDCVKELLAEMQTGRSPVIPFFPEGTEATSGKVGVTRMMVHPGELTIIGAKTGSGKTALCAQAAYEQLKAGLRVVYFCTESSSKEIVKRIIAAATGIEHYRFDECDESKAFFAENAAAIVKNYSGKLHVYGNDCGAMTAAYIRRKLRTLAMTGKIDVVYVDFLQNLTPQFRRRSQLEETNDTIQTLHDTLAEYNACGVIVSQFNREAQRSAANSKTPPKPDITWLKDSSLIEQLAHNVFMLWRKDKDTLTEFYSVKTRNGPAFKMQLGWDRSRFRSAAFAGFGDAEGASAGCMQQGW